ncbi:MAG: hypothetical protein MUF09_05565 [Candidatus Nanopelagicales bacterium]|jgi:hypothetical protein|nr:hypothetical protein [Candidatus Nanopelagicales bacterium]
MRRLSSVWRSDERLTPWVLFDLERVAWVVEQRAAELTDEERRIVREASQRMLRATDPPR